MRPFIFNRGQMKKIIGVLFVFTVGNGYAEESIEYVAEHLLEVPMDARAQSYPSIPLDDTVGEARVQLGYGTFDAGKLNNQLTMFAGQYFFPLNDTWGLIAGGFYDHSRFSGQNGRAIGAVLVVDAPNVPDAFDVDITNVSGTGKYMGGSLALTLDSGGLWRWQFGFAIAALDVDKFKVDFNTKNLADDFSGSFDYAGRYSVKTLFMGLEMTPHHFFDAFVYSPHVIIVSNMPRIGFKGSFTGPDFDYSGNTASAGNGKHIPDNYLGMGLNVEHTSSGLRMDLGATLFTYTVEPHAHKGISNPLFLTLSLPVF